MLAGVDANWRWFAFGFGLFSMSLGPNLLVDSEGNIRRNHPALLY
jgi:hypothetical protein